MRRYILCLLILLPTVLFAQRMNIAGTVQDTVAKTPLPAAVAMAVRIKDSILVGFARTDQNGRFQLNNLSIDTVQVIVSHPKFGDQSYYVFGSAQNHEFDFGKIILPPKTQQLKEVVIYAFKDPVYYKGDTLMYTADSFKVKPNATVEDLIKKLPGMKVDAQGKITSQGKEISQVLVDGDEFFGSDPTVATRNLAANGVESVQVYEKKNDNAGDGGEETVQVMNLQMKEDAKKGYFGKLSAASDFQKYHEGEVLANKFKGGLKVSLFGLVSNTPTSGFGWGDMYKYGLDNESNWQENENGDWTSTQEIPTGIPQTIKGGFYFTDKLGKKTKLGINYTYNNKQLLAGSQTRSQYFLTDTNYVTKSEASNEQRSESHALNMILNQKLDSLTDLDVEAKLNLNSGQQSNSQFVQYYSQEDTLAHQSLIDNENSAKGYTLNGKAKLTKRFKKKDRLFLATYTFAQNKDQSDGWLDSKTAYYYGFGVNDTINQKKDKLGTGQTHGLVLDHTEPLTKKIKLEFEYLFNYNLNSQEKNTKNFFNGEYSLYDSTYSNSFGNSRMTNRLTGKFIYEIKKMTLNLGVRARNVSIDNKDLFHNREVNQSVNNLLPFLWYQYKFNENTRLNIRYTSSSNQPTMDQLQPVADNSNPNQVIQGNAELRPNFMNSVNVGFNTYKPISGKYIWSNIYYNMTNSDFANSITYDSIGRTLSKTVNVNGNYNGGFYLGGGYPLFSKLITLNPSLNGNTSSRSGLVNNVKNITNTTSLTGGVGFDLQMDTLNFGINYEYGYNVSSNTLKTSSSVYTDQTISAYLNLRLPFKIKLETDVKYTLNDRKTEGYNLEYTIWNATISKAFFKNENLILAVSGNDLLNQNINNTRNSMDNVITDTKTNIITRFYMVRLTYKFNSTKTKDNDDEGFM